MKGADTEMFNWIQALHRSPPRPPVPPPPVPSPRRRQLDISPEFSHLNTEQRRLHREILLQRAQILPLRQHLAELESHNPAVEDDYDGRTGRLIDARREREGLDATFAQLRAHYTEFYSRRLGHEVTALTDQLCLQNKDLRKLDRAISLKKFQIEIVLNQETTIDIARQEQRIADLTSELAEEEPEGAELESRVGELERRVRDLGIARHERLKWLAAPAGNPPSPLERLGVTDEERPSRRGTRADEADQVVLALQRNREEIEQRQKTTRASARSCLVVMRPAVEREEDAALSAGGE
jgi:chromosome segregation ATPase